MKIALLLITVLTFMSGCGDERTITEYVPIEGDGSGGDGGGSDGGAGGGGGGGSTKPGYGEVQGLLNNYCASCHANAPFMQSERSLRASTVISRVRGRSMPPANAGKQLPDPERSKILSFF